MMVGLSLTLLVLSLLLLLITYLGVLVRLWFSPVGRNDGNVSYRRRVATEKSKKNPLSLRDIPFPADPAEDGTALLEPGHGKKGNNLVDFSLCSK